MLIRRLLYYELMMTDHALKDGVVSMMRSYMLFAGLLLASLPDYAQAEQSKTFGNYTVHYSAFTTDILSPNIAKIYGISRSKNRALLNISILKKVMETSGSPVKARVDATATNMNAQLRQLNVRELVESGQPGAIYYLAETSVENGETLTYNINFTPEGETQPYTFSFKQQFITK